MVLRRFIYFLVTSLFTIAFAGSAAFAEEEYNVKATYIVNFTKYVGWPDGKAISKQSKINVCVLGDSDIIGTSQIFKAASNEKLSINLVKERNVSNVVSNCHMLFISSSEESKIDEILSLIKTHPVLTIGDFDGFAEHGGIMEFVVMDNKPRIIINKGAAKISGLHIDSDLLGIALKVIDK